MRLSAQSLSCRRLEPVVDHRIELGDRTALEASVVAEQTAHLHLLVEAALLRQVADVVARGRAHRLSEHVDVAGVGQDDVQDHPDRRRLARAVGPDEAVDRAGGHVEREVVDGAVRAERFRDVADGDGARGRAHVEGSGDIALSESPEFSTDRGTTPSLTHCETFHIIGTRQGVARPAVPDKSAHVPALSPVGRPRIHVG